MGSRPTAAARRRAEPTLIEDSPTGSRLPKCRRPSSGSVCVTIGSAVSWNSDVPGRFVRPIGSPHHDAYQGGLPHLAQPARFVRGLW